MRTTIDRVDDAFVKERSAGREKANAAAQSWKASVARDRERERQHNRWRWVRFFARMAANHAAMSEDYQRRAEALRTDGRGVR